MDTKRRLPPEPPRTALHHRKKMVLPADGTSTPPPIASDALPLPLYLTNGIFLTLFFSVAYYLLHRWREKIRCSTPLHVVTLTEIAAIVSLIASLIYLLGFFGIDFVQSFISRPEEAEEEDDVLKAQRFPKLTEQTIQTPSPPPSTKQEENDEELVNSVVLGRTVSYLLEEEIGWDYY